MAFDALRQFVCRRNFASFDNAHGPHLVSLPNQRLASRLVWHSGCISKYCESELAEATVYVLFASVKEKK